MKYKNPNGVRRVLVVLCMLGVLFLSQSAVLTVNAQGDAKLMASTVVEEGTGAVTVTVTLEGNPGIWGLKFKVGYDHSALNLQSAVNGNVFEDNDVTLPGSLDREQFVFVAASNKLEDVTADGTMATLRFSVKEGAAAETYPVTLELIQAINAAGEDVDITATTDEDAIEIRGLRESYPYTGAKITPDFDVVDKGIIVDGEPKVLVLGIDYTVKYTNNVKEDATATVTVVGKGNYVGQDVKATFKIGAIKDASNGIALTDLKGAKLENISPQHYTGKPIYPDLKLIFKDKAPVEYTHVEGGKYKKKNTDEPMDVSVSFSNNTNKGTATILLAGAAGANGKATTVKKTFKINPVDLSKAGDKLTVSVAGVTAGTAAAEVPYAVKGATPKIEVSYMSDDENKVKLVNGKDYTLKFSSNKKAGTGKFTIMGKGNYAKKYAGANTFTIVPLDMKNTRLVAVTAYDGLKAGKVKATVVDENGDILKASQYVVKVYKDGNEYTDKLAAGDKIRVKAVAKDAKNLKNESETDPVDFTVGKNIAKAKITLNFKSKKYTGSEIKLNKSDLKVTIKGEPDELRLKPEGAASDEGYDFEIVSYSNNINKGTATAVVKGIGEYSGTKTIKFKITAKQMVPIKKLLSEILERFR